MQETVRVWDPWVRLLHWSLAAALLAAWLTRSGFGQVHEWLGYLPLLLVLLRAAWGLGPAGHARWSGYLSSPRDTLRYAGALLRGRGRRYLGHNPLGAWMSVLLWLTVLAVCLSGWLYTTDRFWGVEWVERTHAVLTQVLIGLVSLHLAGVTWMSLRHRENLIAAMVHGRKRAQGPMARS